MLEKRYRLRTKKYPTLAKKTEEVGYLIIHHNLAENRTDALNF